MSTTGRRSRYWPLVAVLGFLFALGAAPVVASACTGSGNKNFCTTVQDFSRLNPNWFWGKPFDLDLDGDLDMVIAPLAAGASACDTGGTGTGKPTPASAWLFEDGAFSKGSKKLLRGVKLINLSPFNMVTADFDSDGLLDLFFGESGPDCAPHPGGRSVLALGRRKGGLKRKSLPKFVEFTHDAAAADVDGDGYIDIYESNIGCCSDGEQLNSKGPALFINDGNGKFRVENERLRESRMFPNEEQDWDAWTAAEFADVDGDGDPDLVLGSAGNTSRPERDWVLINDGLGFFDLDDRTRLPIRKGAGFWQTTSVHPADFDGDGDIDLAMNTLDFEDQDGLSGIQLLINDGFGYFEDRSSRLPKNRFSKKNSTWVADAGMRVADFNGDGLPDILASHSNAFPNGDKGFRLYFNRGNLRFTDKSKLLRSQLLESTGGLYADPHVADFDRDGDPDIVWIFGTSLLFTENLKPYKPVR